MKAGQARTGTSWALGTLAFTGPSFRKYTEPSATDWAAWTTETPSHSPGGCKAKTKVSMGSISF